MATITDYARMCKAYECVDCPLSGRNNAYSTKCPQILMLRPTEASAIIDKWCAEHPQKTYLQDFLEKSRRQICSPMFQRVVERIITDGIQKRVKEIASTAGTP